MKKYKIIIYVLFGICLSFYIQDIMSKKTFASGISKTKDYIEEENRPSFINASEIAIQAVVHIKSKYTSNKIIYTIVGSFSGQHDVDIISDKEISIFNNNNHHHHP